MASVGASVAKDSEAKLSMIRFTHSCTPSQKVRRSPGILQGDCRAGQHAHGWQTPLLQCFHIWFSL